MEQLRQVGEAVGGVNALMVFHDDLRINPRQCALLAHACSLAFHAVAGEVSARLRFEDRLTKWKALDDPIRELHRAVRDGEAYIRQCLEPRDWWTRAAAATHATDCVEHLLHNLLWCVAVVMEAVEAVGEVTGSDPDEVARRRLALAKDYDKDLLDPKLFRQRLGKTYLATRELAARMDMAWKEDRWLLSQLLDERKGPTSPEPLTRQEHRLADLLAAPRGKLHPASVLLSDFHMRRRLGGNLKEVQWMGESFAVKHLVGVDADAAAAEVALLAAVSHPNVAHCRYCFHDEEKRELFVVMDQLMSKDLGCYVKEVTSAKRRVPFPLVVVVDTMLQIARGMEQLHSNNIYHGNLNPSNVLVKPRHGDAYLQVKVAGFGHGHGQSAVSNSGTKAPANANANPCIWYAPEALGNEPTARCTEKADVYSFGMICFELLTGKIPFEDNHLQGDNMSKNIRAGERPLFPFQSPKYLTGLTKRCWHGEPAQRPAFHSICRVLRYVKRFLVMNPEQGQPDAPGPPVDYLDIEAQLLRRFPEWQGNTAARVADVPFQMYAYRVMEKEKTNACRDKSPDSSSDGNSLCGDDSVSGTTTATDGDAQPASIRWLPERSGSYSSSPRKVAGKAVAIAIAGTKAGPPQKSRSMGVVRPPPQIVPRRTPRIKSDGHLNKAAIPPSRRRKSGGHGSDSELA
ncbi:light-sensor Protein kinase-like isoform X2 [Oryza brachyantha]|uniref:light-sensor Protein kinase-like isoform X2 n=1 Tax=Oryza brachyantha TaxID=4533 RepID=UPI001ADB4C97|nr:light-sensor Protein kinase-like isoform X2 [Oryza brachyantha]